MKDSAAVNKVYSGSVQLSLIQCDHCEVR